MIRWKRRIKIYCLILIDIIMLLIIYLVGLYIFNRIYPNKIMLSDSDMFTIIVLLIIIIPINITSFGLYEQILKTKKILDLKLSLKLILNLVLAFIIFGSFLYFLHISLSRLFVLYLGINTVIVFLVIKLVISKYLIKHNTRESSTKKIIVVGYSKKGEKYISYIKKYEYLNYKLVGYISTGIEEGYNNLKKLGELDQLTQIAKTIVIDEIAVAIPIQGDKRLQFFLNECEKMGKTISLMLDFEKLSSSKVNVEMVEDIPTLKCHSVSLNESELFMKRVIDIIGSLIGMVLFGIAYIVMGLMIKIETPGPIIFKQKRVGKNGRIFEMWKFRSMGADAEARKVPLMANNEVSGHMFKITNDPRITKIGRFIRRTSIDELPQFWNVLKGDMSLVGTRPPTLDEVNNYDLHHHKRISITPGITGIWQISGRSDINEFEEVVKLDTEYISNWTIGLDIKIILKTVLVVFEKRGSR